MLVFRLSPFPLSLGGTVACLFLLQTPGSGQRESASIFQEDFSQAGWATRWMQQRLASRRTRYQIITDNGNPVMLGQATRSAAALVRPVPFTATDATLSWRWQVTRGLWDNDRERTRRGDDYAARVFVIFGDRLDNETRALCYVWAANEPAGSVYPSPHTDQVRTVVLRTGAGHAGWVRERREIARDYRRAFGEDPVSSVGALALMVDADNTRAEAAALFDDIVMTRVNP